MEEKAFSFWKTIGAVVLLVAVLWAVFFLQEAHLINTDSFANHPRHLDGLKGILFSPFIHGSVGHLMGNSLPLMILLTVLLNAYHRVAIPVLVLIHLGSGILVWLFASPETYHIGASGVVYGIAFYLIAAGIFRRNRASVTIAILVTLVYGGMVAGLFPKEGLSWQSHLYGSITGIVLAYFTRKIDLPPPHPFELEKEEEERHFFDEHQSADGGNKS